MFHWNCFHRKTLWLSLFLVLTFLPLSAQALDLYFYNNQMQITGGANYVIKGNTPADKHYTGGLICELGPGDKLPLKTTITMALQQSSTDVSEDEHAYSSGDWTYNSLGGFYYIALDYSFDMPLAGPGTNQLHTASYNFALSVYGGSGVTESNPFNNLVKSSSFQYTVFSGDLIYDRVIHSISSLTPSTSSVCSGDTYLSSVSGNWTSAWWQDNFSLNSLCTVSGANTDGYSTDLTVIRDVSLSTPTTPSGQLWVIKGQNPADLSLNNMRIECEGSPPKTITLQTRLLSSAILPDQQIAYFTSNLTPVWLADTSTQRYYFELSPSYSLPGDGPTIADLQTGSHTFVSTITLIADAFSPNNESQTDFTYNVFSGRLFFNEVETSYTHITFGSTLCWSDGQPYLQVDFVNGEWSDIFGARSMTTLNLCVSPQDNPDNYSRDLHLFSGAAYFHTVSATVAGLEVDFVDTTLDENGGSFSSATLTLPDDVTAHSSENGKIISRGEDHIDFPGGSFFQTMESLSLSTYVRYLHGYGMPFYLESSAIRLSLSNASLGIIPYQPRPVYVHNEAVMALAPTDLRTSFPSNDVIFHKPTPIIVPQVTVDQNGLNGTLYFVGDTSYNQQTSFPKTNIDFTSFLVTLQDGQISSGRFDDVTMAMEFNGGCNGTLCDDSVDSRWYQVSAPLARLTTSGGFGAQFTDIGPTLNKDLQDTGEGSVEWGDFPGNAAGTYVRHDRNRSGAFIIPGFIMPETSDSLSDPYRLGQILLGSYLFNDTGVPGSFSPLNDTQMPSAIRGDGIFAGINLGPEIYTDLTPGIGEILNNQTLIRFFDVTSLKPQVSMADRPAVKYVLRPGGLTGVFNTAFSGGPIDIYGYGLNFDRFAFRQDRNNLDGNTFIDGSLTLADGPVANGVRDNQQDFDVAFVNLDLTCDGNLGSGQVDSVPEPTWPACDDAGEHKGCQTLTYWNMPVLLTGMAFDYVPGTAIAGECPTENRQLFMHSKNQIDGIGTPLTMASFYSPKGVLHDQEFYGGVKTWFDKSSSVDSSPGFAIRLRKAFVNEMYVDEDGNATLPSLSGFSVLTGFTDVPLFDDVRLAGHFDNIDVDDRQAYNLHIFKDETDNDLNSDGLPDTYLGDTVETLRQRLSSEAKEAPKPFFSYTWPTEDMVNLDYYATYQRSTESQGPKFQGLKESSDIMGVLTVSSVPDYITPSKTKLSLGISADVAILENFQLDLANYISGGPLDVFLQSLGVPEADTMDTILCYPPTGNDRICLYTLEENMLNLTGGDLTGTMGQELDRAMQQADMSPLEGLPLAIQQATAHLNMAHQAHSQINSLLIEPLRDVKDGIHSTFTAEFTSAFSALYSTEFQAAIAIYGRAKLEEQFGLPPAGNLDAMEAQVDALHFKLNRVISYLDNGITAYSQGWDLLMEPTTGVIDKLKEATGDAGDFLDTLVTELNNPDFSKLLVDPDPAVNVLLGEVDKARQEVVNVRNAIENVDLGRLGEILQLVAGASGAAIDTSLIDDVQRTINSSLDELDQSILQANQSIEATYGSITLPLNQMLSQLSQLFNSTSPLQQNLVAINAKLDVIMIRIENLLSLVQFQALHAELSSLRDTINGETVIPLEIVDWDQAQTAAQVLLNNQAKTFASGIQDSLGSLAMTIPANLDLTTVTFNTIFDGEQFSLSLFCEAAFTDILDADGAGNILGLLNSLQEIPSTSLPQPSEEDIRNMIRNTILGSQAVKDLNSVFFAQFGLLSDQLDNISTQLTGRINGLIRQTISSVNEAMSAELSGAVDSIGGWDTTIQSVGIDGYARVSQDEIERIHMDADFVFDGFPDPTSYNAALDATAFQDNNGLTGCGDGESGQYYNVEISTHDVSADMLGMNVGIKEASLGFTINGAAVPVGILGRCYLDGEIGFQSMVLEDLGLEAGIGALQTYLGATGAGHFDEYQIPKAAFYLGKSCSTDRLGVLGRFDPDVGKFVGPEISPLYGVYLRGAADVPVWNNGCALTIGAGADLGAWYFTKPGHGTLGGLVGGSLYGRLGCLAALKGKMQCLGQISGSELLFDGSGWVGAGVGDCSPGSWQSISNVRHDEWCETADASFGVSYDTENGFDIYDYNYHCCD